MKRRSDLVFTFGRMVSDLLMVNFAFLFSYWLRFDSKVFPLVFGRPDISEYIKPLPIISVLILLIMRSFNLYTSKRRLSILDEFFLIIKSMTVGLVVLMAATFTYREFTYSRLMLIICWVDLIIFIAAARFIINRIRLKIRAQNKDYANLLIIGTGPTAGRLVKHIGNDPHWNYKVSGMVRTSIEPDQHKTEGVSILGELEDLPDILSKVEINEIILTDTSLSRELIISIILECEKRMIQFRLIADLLGMITSQVDMENVDGIPLLGLKESPLIFVYNRMIKRATDIFGSLLGLVIFSPLFFIITVLIKCSSKGPAFYFQKRIGEDGKRFAIIKFRTMQDKAEKGVGPVWASKDDPRRTKIGAFLREHNIDELPQLINVLKGQMSLVGPRPERPKFVGRFKEDVPRYMTRHKIKSGITGWAQVNGLRGDTSIEERTKYDIYYIENWSLMFDIKLILMSIFQTIFSKSEHAY